MLRGWQINGVTKLNTGTPLALSTSTNNTNSLGGGSRPNSSGTSAALPGGRSTNDQVNPWFHINVFSQPAPFSFGSLARTLPDVRGPGVVKFRLLPVQKPGAAGEVQPADPRPARGPGGDEADIPGRG